MLKSLGAQSIATRLFISAVFWSSTILILAGLGLSAIYARSAEAAYDDRLGVYLKALVANVAAPGEESRAGAGPVIDPNFELAFSGWYWQITRLDSDHPDIRSSRSLFATQLPRLQSASGRQPPDATRSGYGEGPGNHELRMLEREIDAGDEGRYLIQVAATSEVIQNQIETFEFALDATFLALALGLLGSTALALRFGLRPLRNLQEEVAAIRRGETEQIRGDFPPDLMPLASEVNLLLDANRDVVQRARTQVGNLAHALKTPLSVMINEAASPSSALPDKVREQAEVMRRQVSFYLDRARAAARAGAIGAATDVRPVVDGLVRTFEKLHIDGNLRFAAEVDDALRFRGEAQDLSDLIGNLLDNAGKWAKSRIEVNIRREGQSDSAERAFFFAAIDDDGPGLDPEARKAAIVRGQKLDESRPGSGLGLSIVVELAAVYGGSLSLDESPLGGLRATLRLPSA